MNFLEKLQDNFTVWIFWLTCVYDKKYFFIKKEKTMTLAIKNDKSQAKSFNENSELRKLPFPGYIFCAMGDFCSVICS